MAEQHAQKLATVVVGQIADVCGYERAHRNALDAAADVMMRFVKEVGVYAKEAAEQQGRTDVNALDVADALAEFNCSCADLLTYATNEPSDPFPHTLAAFPVRLQALQPPSFSTSGAAAPAHIPAHLPAFPDAHTVDFTPIVHNRPENEAAKAVEHVAAAQQAAQVSLIKVHQHAQAALPVSRQNPFLQDADVPEEPPLHLAKSEGIDIRAAFEPAVQAAAEAQASPRQDAAMQGSDDDELQEAQDLSAEPAEGWRAVLTTDAAGPAQEPLFKAGRIGFGMDPATQLDRVAAHTAYSQAVEDAFHRDSDDEDGGGGRRRANAYSSDRLKQRRAEVILGLGPDAVLMEFPEGHVPRQGQ